MGGRGRSSGGGGGSAANNTKVLRNGSASDVRSIAENMDANDIIEWDNGLTTYRVAKTDWGSMIASSRSHGVNGPFDFNGGADADWVTNRVMNMDAVSRASLKYIKAS